MLAECLIAQRPVQRQADASTQRQLSWKSGKLALMANTLAVAKRESHDSQNRSPGIAESPQREAQNMKWNHRYGKVKESRKINLDSPIRIATYLGDRKVPQRNSVTKILPNVRGNFLVRFASKPLFFFFFTG